MNPVEEGTVEASGQKEGKRNGYLLVKNKWYDLPPGLIKDFPKGEHRKFEFKTYPRKDGSEGREVVKPIGDYASLPPKQVVRARMDPNDSLEARKTSWGAAFIAAGKCPLNCDAMATMLNEIEEACRRQTNPQRRDDLGDAIDF